MKKKNPVKEFKDNMQDIVNNSKEIDSISISTIIGGEKSDKIVIAEKKNVKEPKNEYTPPIIKPDDKYNFTSKLYLACAEDELRPVMECVHFINGYAYASDGHILIKQSLDYHTILNPKLLDGKSIHKKSFKEIMTFRIAEAKEDRVFCSDGDREAEFMYANCGKPPVFEAVIPLGESMTRKFFGANTKFIDIAGEILFGSKTGCKFDFKGNNSVVLTTMDYEYQLAVIMLINLEPSLF